MKFLKVTYNILLKRDVAISFFLFFSILCETPSIAQDIHFTMFENAPLFMGPANTGLFEGSHRLVFNYRNQWATVTIPYVTMAASADMKFSFRKKSKVLWAAGLSLYNDKAGDSEYGTTQFTIYGAPLIPLNNLKTNLLSLGFGLSFTQKKINYSALYFDSQYTIYGFDMSASSNETFYTTNMFYPDLDVGINFRRQLSRRNVFNVGFTVNHVLGPAQSFEENPDVVLDAKFTLFFHSQKQIAGSFDLCPILFVQQQGTYREIMAGSNVKFHINPNPDNYTAIYSGVYTRVGDMLAFSTGLEYKATLFTFSYDINYSNLRPASHGHGAIEFALIQRFNNYKFSRKKTVSCPVF